MLRTAVVFSQHAHVRPCQDHPAAVLHLAELCRSVHGVCGGGLAVRFQPLHLPLLRSLHCLRKDAPLHHKVSKQVSSIPDTHVVVFLEILLISHFYHFQGFIQDFQFGEGDVVCGLTGMGEYFSQVTPRNGAKSIVVSFC